MVLNRTELDDYVLGREPGPGVSPSRCAHVSAASHSRTRIGPNLYLRGDGVYVAGLTVNGKWTMKRLTARTKREVESAARQATCGSGFCYLFERARHADELRADIAGSDYAGLLR